MVSANWHINWDLLIYTIFFCILLYYYVSRYVLKGPVKDENEKSYSPRGICWQKRGIIAGLVAFAFLALVACFRGPRHH